MGVVQDDFTFATTTGVSSLTAVPFGTAHDCTAESWWEKTYGPCALESEFSINLRDSGVAIEDSVVIFYYYCNQFTITCYTITGISYTSR